MSKKKKVIKKFCLYIQNGGDDIQKWLILSTFWKILALVWGIVSGSRHNCRIISINRGFYTCNIPRARIFQKVLKLTHFWIRCPHLRFGSIGKVFLVTFFAHYPFLPPQSFFHHPKNFLTSKNF